MTHPGLQVCVVAHSHWDREWYHTAERFRQRLVALVDELLDDPPSPGTSFLLDGQAVLLDDYLSVRPERAAELARLLRDGRLEAGPWYVLADELIPGGEALVRNLLAGRDTVRRLRGEPPPVLYCPDSFGHPAILPELAHGFGCGMIVLWRGYGGARWPAGDTVRWRGPSGRVALLHHLPPDGYEFGSSLPTVAGEAAHRWRRIDAELRPRASVGVALLLNGADHHARQRGQEVAISLLASAARPAAVMQTSLADAAARITEAAAAVTLPTVAGELRDSYGYTWTLGGTLGARAAQKRRNARAERALVRDVEPWLALGPARQAGRASLRATWRDLLRGHPHDTLCGTSIDAVADALDHRLAAVESQCEGLREDALLSLLAHDREAARRRPAEWRPALMLRNRAPRTRSGVAEVTLDVALADVAVGPGSGSRQVPPRDPGDPLSALEGAQRIGSRHVVKLTESPRDYPDADLVEEVRALAWVDDIAGYALESRPLGAPGLRRAPHPVAAEGTRLENETLRVDVHGAGQVRITSLVTGWVLDDAIGLEVHRDVGDLYTPAIRESLAAPRFASVERTMSGPLRGELTLRLLDAETGTACNIRLQLDAGLDAVRVLVDGVNAREDMRLRLVVRGGATSALATDAPIATIADAAFHPVARELPSISATDAGMEQLVRTAPLHRYVSRYAGALGLTLFSDGLAEYESRDDGGVAVTLLRAVGALSRADLPERPGHAGWPADTPGAQCRGPYSAELALALHGPDTPARRDAIERLADDVLLPVVGETLRSNLADPVVAGGLELEGAGLAFSAALPSVAEEWITLRCVNRRDAEVEGAWRFRQPIAEAFVARLDETRGESLRVDDTAIHFTAAPREIVTIVARLMRS